MAKKKKQALDDLLAAGRISQSTYGLLEKELNGSIHDLETYQQSLFDKMTARADALEKQVESLELFLANLEIHHAAAEIDEETYGRQNEAITLGLEATNEELADIKSSLMKIVPTTATVTEVTPEAPAEAKATEAVSESVPVAPVETMDVQEVPQGVATEGIESTGTVESKPPAFTMPQEPSFETGSENP